MHRLKSQLAGFLGQARALKLARKASLGGAVLALLIQTFVVQTHVHLHTDQLSFVQSGNVQVAAFESQASLPRSSERKSRPIPADGDRDHCALCQALAVIGNAVAPDGPSLAVPSEISFVIVLPLEDSFHVATLSHDWLSRGPPQT